MSEHAKLAPSSAARRVACPGSRALEDQYPEDQESPHAREGHAAHWAASEMLNAAKSGRELIGSLDNNKAPNGEFITDEMWEGAQLYVDNIMGVYHKIPLMARPILHIEERIDISMIHPECWGTPDCWMYAGNEIYIWDYKYGFGYVNVYENWQMIEYAAGILHELQINGIKDRQTYITFCIVQPRSYNREGPIRTWRVSASTLRGYFNILEAAEYKAAQDNATCHPNPECNYCLGRHACTALQQTTLGVIDMVGSNTPFELKPNSLGNELRYLKQAAELLDARITGLEEQATAVIRRGERVPFWKLESSKGREHWSVPKEHVITMGALLGFDLKKPVDVITPRQAAKAGLQEEIITTISERATGALKLVADDGSNARKVFGG